MYTKCQKNHSQFYSLTPTQSLKNPPLCSRPSERMCLSITTNTLVPQIHNTLESRKYRNLQNPLIQTNHIRFTENQIKVLQRFSHPVTLALIHLQRRFTTRSCHVVYSGVAKGSPSSILNRLKHIPSSVLKVGAASDAVENKHRFDGLRSTRINRSQL